MDFILFYFWPESVVSTNIGGVPTAIVPDNLKTAVIKGSKYEPTLNEAFADFADHYGTTILPARAYRPRDKHFNFKNIVPEALLK